MIATPNNQNLESHWKDKDEYLLRTLQEHYEHIAQCQEVERLKQKYFQKGGSTTALPPNVSWKQLKEQQQRYELELFRATPLNEYNNPQLVLKIIDVLNEISLEIHFVWTMLFSMNKQNYSELLASVLELMRPGQKKK